MIIEYLGHACFRLAGKNYSVVIDPYEKGSVPGIELKNGITANYVFSSHNHHDHNAISLIKIQKCENKPTFSDIIVNHDKNNGLLRGKCKAYIFEIDGYRIAHLGDICDISNIGYFDQLKNLDIVLCPINGFYTISAQEAFKLCSIIKPKLIIPMHYEVKNLGIGYPDNGQIDSFIKLFSNHFINSSYQIELDEHLFKFDAIIFNDYMK